MNGKSFKRKNASYFSSQDALYEDDIEDDPDLQFVNSILNNKKLNTTSSSSTSQSKEYKDKSTSSSSSPTNNNNEFTCKVPSRLKLEKGQKEKSHSSRSLNNSSNGNTTSNSSSRNDTGNSNTNNNYGAVVDNDTDDRFICIFGDICTDTSEDHLKEYRHNSNSSSRVPSQNSNSSGSSAPLPLPISSSSSSNKSSKKEKKSQDNDDHINKIILQPKSPPSSSSTIVLSPTSNNSSSSQQQQQSTSIVEEDDSDILSITVIKDIVNNKKKKGGVSSSSPKLKKKSIDQEIEEQMKKEKEKKKQKEKEKEELKQQGQQPDKLTLSPPIIKSKDNSPILNSSTSISTTATSTTSTISPKKRKDIPSTTTTKLSHNDIFNQLFGDDVEDEMVTSKSKTNTSLNTSSSTSSSTSTSTSLSKKEKEIDDIFNNILINNNGNQLGIKRRKPTTNNTSITNTSISSNTPKLSSSKSSSSTSSNNNNNISSIWIDKYTPKKEDDLVVNNKKILEVKIWLQDRLKEMNSTQKLTQKILVLTGASGIGKSATIKALCNPNNPDNIGFSLEEWTNPSVDYTTNTDNKGTCPYTPPLETFKSWLRSVARTDIFGSDRSGRKKLVFIEEYPNLLPQHMPEFRNAFSLFIQQSSYPLVLVVSDLNTGNSPLHQLFEFNFLNNSLIKKLSFNVIPPATMTKYLQKLAGLEGFNVGEEQIEQLVQESAGDIRAAINNLEFYCIGKDHKQTINKQNQPNKKQQTKKQQQQQSSSSKSSKSPKQREPNLSLFHSLGKILYNKRIQTEKYNEKECWYKEEYYRQSMENVPEEVYEFAHIDSTLFISFLHENFLTFYTDIDEVSESMAYLGVSDLMTRRSVHEPIENSYIDNPMAISVALRGLMYPHQKHVATRTFHQFVKPHFHAAHVQSQQLGQACKDFVFDQLDILQQNNQRLQPNQPNQSLYTLPPSLLGNNQLVQETLPFLSMMRNYQNIYKGDRSPLFLSFLRNPQGRGLLEKIAINQQNYTLFSNSKENQVRDKESTFIDNSFDDNNQNNQNINNDNNYNNKTTTTTQQNNNSLKQQIFKVLPFGNRGELEEEIED